MCLECLLFSPSSLLVVFIFYNLSRSYCSKSCLISLFISFNLLFIDIFFSGFEDYESKHFIPYFKLKFFFVHLSVFIRFDPISLHILLSCATLNQFFLLLFTFRIQIYVLPHLWTSDFLLIRVKYLIQIYASSKSM